MPDIDKILDADSIKQVLDNVCDEADDMRAVVVVWVDKNGNITYESCAEKYEILGMIEILKHVTLDSGG